MARRTIAALLILSMTAACYDRRTVRPDELHWLDGYDIHDERKIEGTVTQYGVDDVSEGPVSATISTKRVLDQQGNPVDFTSEHTLTLTLADRTQQGGAFQSIDV